MPIEILAMMEKYILIMSYFQKIWKIYIFDNTGSTNIITNLIFDLFHHCRI